MTSVYIFNSMLLHQPQN